MAGSLMLCTKCQAVLSLPDTRPGEAAPVRCRQCRAVSQVYRFPAFNIAPVPDIDGVQTHVTDAASCFYHLHKTAVVPCDHCGRFLCDLCTIALSGRQLCPSCLEVSQKQHNIDSLANHRVLYDNVALALAVYPACLLWPTLVTAPIAIFFAAWHWRSPSSIVPRTKVRFVLAITIATLQIGGWIVFLWL